MNLLTQYINNVASRAYKIRIRDRISSTKINVIKSYVDVAMNNKFVSYKDDKYSQTAKVIKMMGFKYENTYYYYFINERIIASINNRVIDNMPIDYSIFAMKSLRELKNYVSDITRNEEMKTGLINIIDAVEDQILYLIDRLGKVKTERAEKIVVLLQRMIEMESGNIDDALQRILIWNSLLHQTGHTLVGLGRIDYILNAFQNDDGLEESLKQFFTILHNHYRFKSQYLAGDTGQLIILGGMDIDGTYFCNNITYSILRIAISMNMPDPKVMLRVSKIMPDDLLQLAVDCIAKGNGSPILSNDDIIIPALIDFGYQTPDVYNYGVSACWEPLIIGESLEQNNLCSINVCKPLLDLLHEKTLPDSFENLLKKYLKRLEEETEKMVDSVSNICWEPDPINSMATSTCLEQGKDISQGGAKYNNYGILTVGLPNVINSLINIKELVYDRSVYSMDEVALNLENDYQLNQEMLSVFSNNQRFGNDDESTVQLTNLVFSTIKNTIKGNSNNLGGGFKVGLSSPSYLDIGKLVQATPDGRKSGTPLNTHISANHNIAFTEIMNFASKLDYSCAGINGNVVDVMTPRSVLYDNIEKYYIFFKQAIANGFFEMQMNVLDSKVLKDAKLHPEKYADLIVRVWGFSAYFNDLPEEYKDNLIRRALEMERAA